MAPYDTTTYLLDRANITDVCMRLIHYYDTFTAGGEAGLRDQVFAETIDIDYTAFGLEETKGLGRDEWVGQLGKVLGLFKATQHVISGLIIELPQPGPKSTRPTAVEVTANASGHLVKSESETEHNGGGYKLQLVRDKKLEEEGLNPWRIRKQTATKTW